jgi:hypothetical protein
VAKVLLCILIVLCSGCAAKEQPRLGTHSAAIQIGSEIAMDAPVPAWGSSTYSVAGYCAGVFLVTWSEGRAARIRASDGQLLDPVSILVRRNPLTNGPQQAIGCSGNSFLVVWDGMGTIVDPATGQVSPVDGFSLSPLSSPAIAFDGTRYLVVGTEGSTAVSGQRVGPDGSLIDAQPFPIAAAAGNPSVTFDGTNYFVAWEDNRTGQGRDIYAARVRPSDGVVLDGTGTNGGIPISTRLVDQTGPVVSADNANVLVVWGEPGSGGATEILGNRVRKSDLALLDGPPASGGVTIDSVNASDRISVAFDGMNHLVTWVESDGHVRGNRVRASDFALLDGAPTSGGHLFGFYGLTTGWLAFSPQDSVYFAAASDGYGTRIRTTDLAELDGPPYLFYANYPAGDETKPSVGYVDGMYLVVWQDFRTPTGIYAVRVRASDGVVLDAPAIQISANYPYGSAPAVAVDSSTFLVVWNNNDLTIHASRVRASDGALLDGAGGIVIPAAAYPADVGCIGGTCLITFRLSDVFIYGVRMRIADGQLLGAPFPIINQDRNSDPSVAAGNSRFLVAATHWVGGDIDLSTWAALVTAVDGAVTVLPPLATRTSHGPGTAAAFDGSNFLVAYVFQDYGVYGTRVRESDGALLDAAGGFALTSSARQFRLEFDGTDYVLLSRSIQPSGRDLYFQRIRTDGSLIDYPVSTGGIDVPTPTVTQSVGLGSSGVGQLMVTYDRYVPDDAYRVERSFGRLIDLRSNACTQTGECAVGMFCVDGVCCDSQCGGGDPTDCQACSVLAGAAQDGHCGPVAQGRACGSQNACLMPSSCDGTSVACPPQQSQPNGTACPGGSCLGGVCTGSIDAGMPDAQPPDGSSSGSGGSNGAPRPSDEGGCSTFAAPANEPAPFTIVFALLTAAIWCRPRSKRR